MDARQSQVYFTFLITFLVIGIVFIYFVISLIRQQKRTLELRRLNVLAEINTLEKERSRIAKDLHDDLGPTLTLIKFQVNTAQAVDAEDQELLEEAGNNLDDMVKKVRDIAHNLMPSVLIRKGLATALKEYIDGISENSPLHIQFNYNVDAPISSEKSINLYRILLEVIQNTMKHAQAKDLLIDISQKENNLVVLCEDNGRGFDYEEQIKDGGGIGLRNFTSRVSIMNGRVKAYSQKGTGTQYIFTIPIHD